MRSPITKPFDSMTMPMPISTPSSRMTTLDEALFLTLMAGLLWFAWLMTQLQRDHPPRLRRPKKSVDDSRSTAQVHDPTQEVDGDDDKEEQLTVPTPVMVHDDDDKEEKEAVTVAAPVTLDDDDDDDDEKKKEKEKEEEAVADSVVASRKWLDWTMPHFERDLLQVASRRRREEG